MSSPRPKIHVAIVGVGLVGSELVRQILALPTHSSPFSLISLSSSTRVLFDAENPIDAGSPWRERLASAAPENLENLTPKLVDLVNAGKRVALVDNTSSMAVASLYPAWLEAGINVVTPNKKGFSGDTQLYNAIVDASLASGARFYNEATVGAGLPVIATLKDLVATGDKIIKVEGVFSGTLSYIFNEFSAGKPDGPSFSSVVSLAREKGYTEPHPGDDLNGVDVARKLTILSRIISTTSESSLPRPDLQSFESVQTASLIPPALVNLPTGDEFLSRLPEYDEEFSQMRTVAASEGKVLRFVGVLDVAGGQVRAGLEKYPVTHPFATSLGGSDNIMMFHTERYSPRPLIIQGAGAGAAVTAMGVLGDLFKLA